MVMRTSGPVFVVGGDYEVGSRTRLREWTGYSVFKKKKMRNEVLELGGSLSETLIRQIAEGGVHEPLLLRLNG